jgi:hypothetical protein
MINLLQTVNLVARLAVELAALGSLSCWGFHLARGTAVRIAAGIGAPLIAAVLWALFASPNTHIPVNGATKTAVQLLVFAAAASALVRLGRTHLAIAFAVLAAVNAALMNLWAQ